MYGNMSTAASGTTGAGLAFTGAGIHSLALVVAGTTLLAATLAARNILPRIHRR